MQQNNGYSCKLAATAACMPIPVHTSNSSVHRLKKPSEINTNAISMIYIHYFIEMCVYSRHTFSKLANSTYLRSHDHSLAETRQL